MLAGSAVPAGAGVAQAATRTPVSYLPFKSTSYWSTRLPRNAPVARDSRQIIAYLETHSTTRYVSLAGTASTGAWGAPIYRARSTDPRYRIRNSCRYPQPSEFTSVRIPVGARPDPTPDAEMTVYDARRGFVYGLWRATYNPTAHTWSACGGTVYYLSSNGLQGTLPESDQPRNFGHRGVPPNVFAVTLNEIRSGAITHMLKISVARTKCRHVFPMVGDECGTSARYAPPEGTRLRIKPGVDLRHLGLSPAALIIARALKHYGAVIGDQSGGAVTLKVENTVAEGRGWRWRGVLNARSLARVPLRDFQVVRPGYGR
jgi:hypothetical protein